MKRKTSITLSEDIVRAIDRARRKGENRSRIIERLLREQLAEHARRLAYGRELEVINQHADALNREAEDVLSYQVEW